MSFYLYRAINENDLHNLSNPNCEKILAIKDRTDYREMLDDVALHVRNASSDKQEDCWISTGKDLSIIIDKYAIPQNAGFCTAKARKKVAVINLSYWNSVGASTDCYTIFCNQSGTIIDFSEYESKGDSDKRKITEEILKKLKDSYDHSKGAPQDMRSLFDCSFEGGKNVPFNKMAVSSFANNEKGYSFGLFRVGLTAVQNGIAKKSREVLCYREIPKSQVVTILEPIQQDVLYLMEEADQNRLIEEIGRGNVSIDWDGNNSEVIINNRGTVERISGEKWMYPGMIYDALASQSQISDLEAEYREYSERKREFIIRIIKTLGYEPTGWKKLPEEQYEDLSYGAETKPFRGLWVCDFDRYQGCMQVNKDTLVSLTMLQYQGKIYASMITTNTIGQIEIIEKNPKGIIGDLIKDHKLMVV